MLEDFSKKLFERLKNACDSCLADSISLSGGIDSTILAYFLKDRKLEAISVITKDFHAEDLTYCQLASREFDLPLTIINAETLEILEGVKETISILKNFNDIEIRNNLVMYLSMMKAKESGLKSIVTGDGADELFAGYSFFINKNQDELEKEIERICSLMHFPTQKIGKALGIDVENPYLNEEVIDLAKKIPVNLKVGSKNGKKYGKWILRKTFENKIPFQIAWRKKSPMQDGAGTSALTQFFESLIPDSVFLEKKMKIKQDDGIIIRTKESMHYFDIYKNQFGLPEKKINSPFSCPNCHFGTNNSKFCRMCGSYPI